jgi:hypothetical protein
VRNGATRPVSATPQAVQTNPQPVPLNLDSQPGQSGEPLTPQ